MAQLFPHAAGLNDKMNLGIATEAFKNDDGLVRFGTSFREAQLRRSPKPIAAITDQ